MNAAAPTPLFEAATPADPVMRRARALALAGVLALIGLGLAWELWLAPTGSGTLALKVVPLMLTVLGLMRHRMYTYRWLSLLVWCYFCEGVVRAATETGLSQRLAMFQIALCLLLFTACTIYIRWRLKQAPKGAT